jgi:hypothetical protein
MHCVTTACDRGRTVWNRRRTAMDRRRTSLNRVTTTLDHVTTSLDCLLTTLGALLCALDQSALARTPISNRIELVSTRFAALRTRRRGDPYDAGLTSHRRTRASIRRWSGAPFHVLHPTFHRTRSTIHFNPGPSLQSTHATVLNTLTRVQRFLDVNGAALGSINQSGYRAILDDVVTTLNAHAVTQTSSKRMAAAVVAKERVLRNALKLNHMRPVSAVAAAQLRQVPEFLALKMPPVTSTSRTLIAWAGAMGTAARAYVKTFVDAGLPPDFLAQMQAAAETLNSAITSRGATNAAQRGASAGLDAESQRGRSAVKVLDSLVEPLIAGDVSLLSQWKSAKRFGRRAGTVADTSLDAASSGTASIPEPTTSAPTPTPTPSQPDAPNPPTATTTPAIAASAAGDAQSAAPTAPTAPTAPAAPTAPSSPAPAAV